MSSSPIQLGDGIEPVRRGRLEPTVTARFRLADAPRGHGLMVDTKP